MKLTLEGIDSVILGSKNVLTRRGMRFKRKYSSSFLSPGSPCFELCFCFAGRIQPPLRHLQCHLLFEFPRCGIATGGSCLGKGNGACASNYCVSGTCASCLGDYGNAGSTTGYCSAKWRYCYSSSCHKSICPFKNTSAYCNTGNKCQTNAACISGICKRAHCQPVKPCSTYADCTSSAQCTQSGHTSCKTNNSGGSPPRGNCF